MRTRHHNDFEPARVWITPRSSRDELPADRGGADRSQRPRPFLPFTLPQPRTRAFGALGHALPGGSTRAGVAVESGHSASLSGASKIGGFSTDQGIAGGLSGHKDAPTGAQAVAVSEAGPSPAE
ncbi:hypothetical protein GCM10010232_12090 [Streptomyces amakusaensis]